MKKAVSAEIFIPLEAKTCQPSKLYINGIPIASFPAHEAIANLPALLDKMEVLAGYHRCGCWTKAETVSCPRTGVHSRTANMDIPLLRF